MSNESSAVTRFEKTAKLYGEAVFVSDTMAVNNYAIEMGQLFEEIRTSPRETQEFLELLGSSDASVRLMSSAFGLRLNEAACISVLEALANAGPYSFEASQCLQRWRDGEWALDLSVRLLPDTTVDKKAGLDVADLVAYGRSLPKRLPLSQIGDLDELDMRIGCVNIYFANIIAVDDGGVEFCPSSEPPTKPELLAWTWIVRPDLKAKVIEQLRGNDLAQGISKL